MMTLRRRVVLLGIGVGILVTAVLGVVSYREVYWDGGYPMGEFKLTVRDPNGRPIQGAVFNVYERGTDKPTYDYPFPSYRAGQTVTSNAAGQFVLRKYEEGGLEFGGHFREIFWCIRWDEVSGPWFDGVISAKGFRPKRFDIRLLFDLARGGRRGAPRTSVTWHGKELQLPTYEQGFVLTPKEGE